MPQFTIKELAEHLHGVFDSEPPSLLIAAVKPLHLAGEGEIAVVARRSELTAIPQSRAAALVVAEDAPAVSLPAVRVRNPRFALARLLELFHPCRREATGVDPHAVIAPGVRLGRDVNIGPFVYLGRGVRVGDRVDILAGSFIGDGCEVGSDTAIFANVSVYPGTIIGRRVRIHSGAVIGADGFGYTPGPQGELHKIPQVGKVQIEDDVEIGANTTVDRGTMAATRVGRGTKIDNLAQIAHNVEIGEHVCIVGQSGVAGSVRIGSGAVLGAAAGVLDHVEIGERAQIAAQSGVAADVPADTSVCGTPAIPLGTGLKAYTLIARLPEMRRRLRELDKRCRQLEAEVARLHERE